MLRYALYARKSDERREVTEKSTQEQLAECRRLADGRGRIVREFQESKSAKVPGVRPHFDELLRLIEKGEVNALLCWKVDRLARNMKEGGALSQLLIDGKIREIRTPHACHKPGDNILPLVLETATSTQYSLDLKINVERGLTGHFERGGWNACAPQGYRNDRDLINPKVGIIVPDEPRFTLIRKGSECLPVPVARTAGFGHGGREAERQIEPRIARMEAEMDAARSRGILGLMRLRYEAWMEEKMKGPAIAKMQARQALLEEQRKTAEAEIRLKATVQSGEVGAQRHRIEWNEVNRQRLAGELQSLGMITLSPGPAVAAPPPVSAHVTDEQVEAVALRGFLQGVETEEDWLVYRAELGQHLSPYAVEEVGARLRELWRLNRQAQAGV